MTTIQQHSRSQIPPTKRISELVYYNRTASQSVLAEYLDFLDLGKGIQNSMSRGVVLEGLVGGKVGSNRHRGSLQTNMGMNIMRLIFMAASCW